LGFLGWQGTWELLLKTAGRPCALACLWPPLKLPLFAKKHTQQQAANSKKQNKSNEDGIIPADRSSEQSFVVECCVLGTHLASLKLQLPSVLKLLPQKRSEAHQVADLATRSSRRVAIQPKKQQETLETALSSLLA